MRLRPSFALRRRPWRASDALPAFPLALIGAIAVVDVITPNGVPLGPLLIVAPAITASFAGTLVTGLIGAVAVACLLAIGLSQGEAFLGSMYYQSQLISLVVVSVIVTVFRCLRERHSRELAQVRTVSEAAQRVLLRPLPRRLGPLRVASVYLAAEAEAQIGGDLYAAVRNTSCTRLIVGDVMGRGLTAISDAALLLGAFREAASRQATLPDLMAYLDRSVCWDLAAPTESEKVGECFITAAIVDIPDAVPRMRMVTCGHPPPLLLRRGEVTPLHARRPAPPLGLGELTAVEYLVDTLLVRHLRAGLLAHVGGHLADDAAMVAIQRAPTHEG
ncbi:PP2C family protein-serine/threonine phosphatase [Microtetraspora niveoalba]|uniref:PP2C family protein-serine/threonine phosphatase n=1 Tax=Microtetraspora niveoalba TaxID=46175 RepID=UPI00082ED979|nr:PP2C family protein-serine/threonine phosphatase [Microtetraspora niveoalba]